MRYHGRQAAARRDFLSLAVLHESMATRILSRVELSFAPEVPLRVGHDFSAGRGFATPVFGLVELIFAPEGLPESRQGLSVPVRRLKSRRVPSGRWDSGRPALGRPLLALTATPGSQGGGPRRAVRSSPSASRNCAADRPRQINAARQVQRARTVCGRHGLVRPFPAFRRDATAF